MLDRNQSSIGVFDSGVGGVSVLKALQSALPDESFIYAADSANAPYGDKSKAFIEARTSAMASFLAQAKVKAIVVACNTATVVAVEALRANYSIPVIAMEPAIKPAVQITRSGVVGVLATERTLESPALANLCRLYGETVEIVLQPCPGLVEQVERGEAEAEVTHRLLRSYIGPLLARGADTIVLGCTHYVFLMAQIRKIVGPGITIVESSAAVARQLERRLSESRKLADGRGNSEMKFFTTGPVNQAQAVISELWGASVHVQAIEAPDVRTVA
ncbi:MAG: glutamate racemase [Gammaproteobacteria bacterium]|nr:MAG: glutamate racemase [Gammaproteobacteria bacterium]